MSVGSGSKGLPVVSDLTGSVGFNDFDFSQGTTGTNISSSGNWVSTSDVAYSSSINNDPFAGRTYWRYGDGSDSGGTNPEAVFGGFHSFIDGDIGGTGDDTAQATFYHDFSGQDLGVHFVGGEVFVSDEWKKLAYGAGAKSRIILFIKVFGSTSAVSYTHLTLPTNREV